MVVKRVDRVTISLWCDYTEEQIFRGGGGDGLERIQRELLLKIKTLSLISYKGSFTLLGLSVIIDLTINNRPISKGIAKRMHNIQFILVKVTYYYINILGQSNMKTCQLTKIMSTNLLKCHKLMFWCNSSLLVTSSSHTVGKQ